MLKIIVRITIILLVAGLLSAGLYYLVNGSQVQRSLTRSGRLNAQNQANFAQGTNTSGDSQVGSLANTRQFAARGGFGERDFLGGQNLLRGFSGILQNLVVIGLITLIVIPTRKIFIRISHLNPVKMT